MIPLASCSGTGCPGVYLDSDGSVVVQGEFLDLVIDQEPVARYGGTNQTDVSTAGGQIAGPPLDHVREARVRIPVDVHRRSVLDQAIGYEVQVNGETLMFDPADVRVIFYEGGRGDDQGG